MQKLQLSIPEPCHENWQSMTPTEQGRFCNACAKEVVDFSMMTDREVLNYFSVLSHEKVCGRALPSQLDRHITMPKEPKKRLFWYWNYIVMFLMFFSKSNYSKAQKGEVVTVPVKKEACSITLGQMVAGVQVNHIMVGRITDSKGAPIPFASIMVKNQKRGVAADADGAYSITVSKEDYLRISAIGFQTREVAALDKTDLNISLENNPETLGGAVVITTSCIKRESRTLGGLKVTPIDTTKNNPVTPKNITTGLTGKAKGLQVSQAKDDTDKSGTQIRMGAVSSILGRKQALLVVDSVPYPISYIGTLNPNDIESVKVLKGSPASALYGSSAYNGVIIVTTKKKKAEDKIKIAKDSIAKSIINKISDTVKLVVNTSSIKIYPNPVQKGNDFLVSLKQQQINDLNIQVIDMQGRVMLQRHINATAKEHIEKVETDSKWGGGVYYIRVFDNNNKEISKTSFIVL